jgi:hypothetical protein
MALEVTLLKQPFEISFSGNPLPFCFAISPYTQSEKLQDIRLNVRVLVENAFGSNDFSEVMSQSFYPDDSGQVKFDVQSIVEPYLTYFFPGKSLRAPVEAIGQRKRYRVDYYLQKAGVIQGTLQSSAVLNTIKGGMATEEWHPSEFFTKLIIDDKISLQHNPAAHLVRFPDMRYLYWVYPFDDFGEQTINFKILLSTGVEYDEDFPITIICDKWGVCCIPVGPDQAQVSQLLPMDIDNVVVRIVSYKVSVKVGADFIVNPVTYTIDHRNFYNATQLLYRNSIGAIETIPVTGQIDFEADYNRLQVQRSLPPSWYTNLNLLPQLADTAMDEAAKFKGNTGFLNQSAGDKLRDLFLSREKMEFKNGKFIPVVINQKNVKFFANREKLISIAIEWQPAYINNFYTPAGTMPLTRACPAVESFAVKQLNKNLLQVMYALANPYDTIEIQIDNGTTVFIFYKKGNTGSFTQTFDNPATTDPVDITIKARTVCDLFSNPVDLGAFTTIVLSVIGNSLPVANDDTYNIAYGFTTAIILPGTVLDNDYDPDGDALEVTADSGATDAGGAFDIDAAGVITYTPPSGVFSGQDFFDYGVHETGGVTDVVARVFLNVGTGVIAVYGKIVKRNESTTSTSLQTTTNGQIWIDFFADPGATQPVDITPLGISFNYRKAAYHRTAGGVETTTNTDSTIAGTGYKVKIYEGVLYNKKFQLVPGGLFTVDQNTFTLRPGTGYLII